MTVIALAGLAYGAVNACALSLHARNLSDADTGDRDGSGDIVAAACVGGGAGPRRADRDTQGIASVFLMFAIVAMLGALAASRMLETRDRQLEDIAS